MQDLAARAGTRRHSRSLPRTARSRRQKQRWPSSKALRRRRRRAARRLPCTGAASSTRARRLTSSMPCSRTEVGGRTLTTCAACVQAWSPGACMARARVAWASCCLLATLARHSGPALWKCAPASALDTGARHQAGGADLHSSKPLLTARPRRRAPAQLVARPGRRPPALPQARDDRGPHRRGRISHRERGAARAGAGAPLLCAHHGSQLGFLQYCQAACCRCAALPPGASRELAAERPCVFT